MADPYERAKGGKLTFKGGVDPFEERKKKKKKRKKKKEEDEEGEEYGGEAAEKDDEGTKVEGGEILYTIDAAKRLKYEQLFPVETKKFGYVGDSSSKKPSSVEEALDDRVKKKADRYCK